MAPPFQMGTLRADDLKVLVEGASCADIGGSFDPQDRMSHTLKGQQGQLLTDSFRKCA